MGIPPAKASAPRLRTPLAGRSVKSRLIAINALLLVAQCAVGAIAWYSVDVQNRAMSELGLISKAARYHQEADALGANVRADVYATIASAARQTTGGDPTSALLSEHVADLNKDLRTLARLDLPPDLVESLEKVQAVAELFIARARQTVQGVADGAPPEARSIADFAKASSELGDAMEQQTQVLASRIISANELAESSARTAKVWLVAAALLTTFLIACLVAVLGASIRRSLARVRDVAQQIASGNLAVRNEDPGHDEVGQLATAINQMADSLNDVIGRLREDADRDAFNKQLADALDAADTEAAAHRIISRAMHEISPALPAELLVSDSSRSHFERAAVHPGVEPPGCDVESPYECLALRRGTAQNFPDSDALSVCSHLRGRPCGRASAVCVPLLFMGRAIGVLHAAAPYGEGPNARQTEQLTALGTQAGARIGTVRAIERTQTQASTDVLTGLTNRRAAGEVIRAFAARRKAYSFVLCDLDQFKQLNDRFGHDAGDAALRMFADVLRRVVRDGDVVVRWGGEEFALILPDTKAEKAAEVVERTQSALRDAVGGGSGPVFTCSFGIADSSMAGNFRELARLADTALYESKDAGRDRWTIADPRRKRETNDRHAAEYLASIDVGMVETGQYEMIETWAQPAFGIDVREDGPDEPPDAEKHRA